MKGKAITLKLMVRFIRLKFWKQPKRSFCRKKLVDGYLISLKYFQLERCGGFTQVP